MKFTTSDNIEIDYEYSEGNNPLVFIHGWLQEKSVWTEIIEEFEDHAILTLDLRGHGESDEPTKQEDYSITRMAQDVHELIEHHNMSKPTIIGHSMGGMIAMQYAITYEAKQLFILNTAARNPTTMSAHEFVKRALNLIEEAREEGQAIPYLNAHPLAAAECIRNIRHFNIVEQLKNIQEETYILTGENDAVTPISYAEEIHQHIPNSELHILVGAGHNTPLSHKQEIIEHLHNFL